MVLVLAATPQDKLGSDPVVVGVEVGWEVAAVVLMRAWRLASGQRRRGDPWLS